MATNLSGSITLQIQMVYQNALDFSSPTDSVNKSYTLSLTDGTGLNQAQKMFSDARSTDNTGESLDLSTSGGLTTAFGADFSLTKIKAIIIVASTANPTTVVVSRPATAGAGFFDTDGDSTTLRPGGWFVWTAPDATAVTITNSTDDAIKIAAGTAATVAYDIFIIGI